MEFSGVEWNKRLKIVNIQKEMSKKYNLEISYKHELVYQRYLTGQIDHEEFKKTIMSLAC